MLCVKAFSVWLVVFLAAFVNGGIREMLMVPRVGEQVGHVIGLIVFSGAIIGVTYVFVKALEPLPSSTLSLIGLFWLILSLLFEFGFFHYVMNESWSTLLADYNIFRGRLFIVVWVVTLFSQLVCGMLLHHREEKGLHDGEVRMDHRCGYCRLRCGVLR